MKELATDERCCSKSIKSAGRYYSRSGNTKLLAEAIAVEEKTLYAKNKPSADYLKKAEAFVKKYIAEKGSVANCATVPGNATAARSSAAATRNTMALSKAIREAGDDCRHGGFLMKQPDKYAKVMRKLAGKVII